MKYRQVTAIQELEVVNIEIWFRKENIKINPCKQLEKSKLESILDHWRGNIIWCGDFNAHSTEWGDQDDSMVKF